ncbi:hypothetical protein B0H15DRAFT_799639 [Mycena belliarum]|uniref:Uncharacterized protein n=1 Tax=Mycena belliarum TaxID=1033014 RepID=A0AAD6XNP0_9AGAR|nr:hypothetical protein B0H15DRAFT_799639 [Mycena belliae]
MSIREEKADTGHEEKVEKSSNSLPMAADNNFDFGGESVLPPPPTLTAEEERKLWRKIDLRLMPILSLMYLLSFLDRSIPCAIPPEYDFKPFVGSLANIGNARLQGLGTKLNLT